MKIAINTYPLQSKHNARGIGSYTSNLIEAFKQRDDVDLIEFTDISNLETVDIVHYPWFDLFFKTLPIKKKFPTVITIHDVAPLLFPQNYPIGLKAKINFFLQKVSLKSCKFIITDSNSSKNDIAKYLKINENKIKVVHLSPSEKFKVLPTSSLLQTKRRYNLPDKFILYVGDANYVKNLPFLIKGFKSIISNLVFKDLKLVLINGVFLKKIEDSTHTELRSLMEVNKLIKEYTLEDLVIRPGQVSLDDLVGFYNLATIYVQPSIYEGFGLPVLEAMACGCPVISSEKGSLKEVGGNAAIYFDPQNFDQFNQIVVNVLQDPSFQKKLSKMSLYQSSKFSWERVADETIKVYRQAVDFN